MYCKARRIDSRYSKLTALFGEGTALQPKPYINKAILQLNTMPEATSKSAPNRTQISKIDGAFRRRNCFATEAIHQQSNFATKYYACTGTQLQSLQPSIRHALLMTLTGEEEVELDFAQVERFAPPPPKQ